MGGNSNEKKKYMKMWDITDYAMYDEPIIEEKMK